MFLPNLKICYYIKNNFSLLNKIIAVYSYLRI